MLIRCISNPSAAVAGLFFLISTGGMTAATEQGLTMRLYDVGEPLDRLYPLVPGQTPNFDEKREVIRFSGSADFAGLERYFIVECFAELQIETAGDYRFRLIPNEAASLKINGETIASADAAVFLAAGPQPIEVRYYHHEGDAALELQWQPPGAEEFSTVPAAAYRTTAEVTRVVAPGKKSVIRPGDGKRPGKGQPLAGVHPSWQVAQARPSWFHPKVGAMAFHPDGRLFVSTFEPNQAKDPTALPGGDGVIWALENVGGDDPEAITVTKVASGLSEPLGMTFIDGEPYVSQRLSLTRLRDTTGDGLYDTHDVVSSGWESGNYHHFHFGLIARDGFAYSTLSTSIYFNFPGLSGPNPPNRGTLVRTDLATGEIEYLAGGLRTPNGLCFGPEGAIFQTDNQGSWLPASRLNHLQPGGFYGHYNTTEGGGTAGAFEDQPLSPPAVFFPQNECANSPSQPLMIHEGDFAGDLLVGEVTLGGINRVSLDKVNGVWQGCVYRFTHGLEAGVNRLAWGPDGALYVGCIGGKGNWSWQGTTNGLQRLSRKPGAPVTFEIRRVTATADGFEINFTKPVPAETLGNPEAYGVSHWHYQPTVGYGGRKIDEEELTVASATVSADRMTVTLAIPGLTPGRVVRLTTDPLSDDGEAILSAEVWYTLNEIPAASS